MAYTSLSEYYARTSFIGKNYKRILFRDGRVVQGAELNESQLYLQQDLSVLANALVGDGSFLVGGKLIWQNNTAYLQDSVFYAIKHTHTIAQRTIICDPFTTTTFGIGLRQYSITEDNDAELKNPATNTAFYNYPGAARLKIDARWIKESEKAEDEDYYAIHTVENGSVIT
ncbi:MAG: DUF4815 domain-containing protein, partial [Desulfovibrionaceae bacterium]|nr:DUF4815 domain-containing protein [Desulfovibrionaceae bacterium]